MVVVDYLPTRRQPVLDNMSVPTMEACKRSKLRGEALDQMQEGVSLMFSRWVALQDAVRRGFGGPYSREKEVSLITSVIGFFSQSKSNEPLYIDDLEDLLYDGVESLNLITNAYGKGDVEEVAEKLMIMHEECLEGNYQSVQRLREVSAIPRAQYNSMGGGNDDSKDSDDNDLGNGIEGSTMINSSSNNEEAAEDMEVDDGWIPVSRKKNKGRKK